MTTLERTGHDLTLELLEIAHQFEQDRLTGKSGSFKRMTVEEADSEGWITLPTPPEGAEVPFSDSKQPDIAPIINKAVSAPNGVQAETRKCFACLLAEFIGDDSKSAVARIGGVSRVWLNDALKGEPVTRRKVISFLDAHRVQDSAQQEFLTALEQDANAQGKTSFTRLDRLSSPSPSTNGH